MQAQYKMIILFYIWTLYNDRKPISLPVATTETSAFSCIYKAC